MTMNGNRKGQYGQSTATNEDALRTLVREAHEAIKDLRDAIREARSVSREIDKEAIRAQVDAIASELAGKYSHHAEQFDAAANEILDALNEREQEVRNTLENAATHPARIIEALNSRPLPAAYAAPPGMECSWCDCTVRFRLDDYDRLIYIRRDQQSCAGCRDAAEYIAAAFVADSTKAVCGRHMTALRIDVINAMYQKYPALHASHAKQMELNNKE